MGGDERRYADVIAIRAVETVDFMTANWAFLPHEFLDEVSKLYPAQCHLTPSVANINPDKCAKRRIFQNDQGPRFRKSRKKFDTGESFKYFLSFRYQSFKSG